MVVVVGFHLLTFRRRTTEEDNGAGGSVVEDQLLESDPESCNLSRQKRAGNAAKLNENVVSQIAIQTPGSRRLAAC